MKYRALLEADPAVGRVERIGLRPARDAAVVEVQQWTPGETDHAAATTDRAITLIQAEHIPVIAAILGRPVDALQLRRNLVVSRINLAALLHRRFRVGELLLEATEICDPCKNMEAELGPGGYAAMVGMGGLCARILTHGTLRVGDEVCASS